MICLDAEVIGPWVCARAGGQWTPGAGTAIGWLKDNRLVAGVLYCEWNGAQVVSHIAGEGNWLKRPFLWVMFDYPFNQLGVQRITGLVPAKNLAARRFDEHLGFVIEATLEDALPGDDLIVYRLRREDCRWLSLKGPKNGQEILHTENA